MTTPLKPCPDAVEALTVSFPIIPNCKDYTGVALHVIKRLYEQGFTITRQLAMTEAELEREAFQLAVDIWECGAERDLKNDTDKCKKWIVELAKKYRG